MDDSWMPSPAVSRPERTSQYARSAPRAAVAVPRTGLGQTLDITSSTTAYSPIPVVRDAFAAAERFTPQASTQNFGESVVESSLYDDDREDVTYTQGEISRIDLFRGSRTVESDRTQRNFPPTGFGRSDNDDSVITTIMPERFGEGDETSIGEQSSIQELKHELVRAFWKTQTENHEDEFESSEQMFELVQNHIALVAKKAPLLPTAKQASTAADILQLKKERNTWRLLHTVLRDHLGHQEPMLSDFNDMTDKMIVDQKFKTDGNLRQSQFVVEWLEEIARFEFDQFIDARNYESADVCWRSTMDSIRASRQGKVDADLTVTTMDPDAPMRSGGRLAPQDEDDENRLLRKIFALLRVGDFERAKNICIKAGQPWRATTLDGWKFWHDAQVASMLGVAEEYIDDWIWAPKDGSESQNFGPQSGNFYRDMWKLTCLEMSNQDGYTAHERAIYAALGGNLMQLLKVCTSWEDALWAHFRVLVDRSIEKALRQTPLMYRDSLQPLPEYYDATNLDPKDIFDELRASPNDTIRDGAAEPYHRIQAWVILFCLDNEAIDRQQYIDEIVTYLHNFVSSEHDPVSQHLRFFTHLIIFLRDLGLLDRERDHWSPDDPNYQNFYRSNEVIKNYIANLMEEKSSMNYEFIARYTSELDRKSQVSTYAAFLNEIDDTATRRQCLQYAEDANLDVSRITKEVVQNITRTGVPGKDLESIAETNISTEDRSKIQSIEWLTFHRADRLEALVQSNTVMRGFISARKIAAAQEVLLMLPTDAVDIVQTAFVAELQHDRSAMHRLTAAVIEHKGIKAYIEANDAFNAWFKHVSEKPVMSSTELGVTEVQQSVMQASAQVVNARREQRWREQCHRLAEDVEFKILAALGENETQMGDVLNWFVAGAPDDERGQLRLLKRQCIPQLFTNLHTVLHESGKYRECIKIADFIVASDELVELFSDCKHELRMLLKAIRESSLMILQSDQSVDALGYQLVPHEQ